MARPQKFDREELLNRATKVFWEQGYEATSIPDLTQRMGILSGSLYHTFGDKHSLFIACLLQYSERTQALFQATLNAPGSKKAAIHSFFEMVVAALIRDPQRKGCLLTNAAGECGSGDASVLQILESSRINTEEALYQALTEAEQAGEIPERTEAQRRVLAQTLVSALKGIHLTARMVSEPDQLYAIARTTLELLD